MENVSPSKLNKNGLAFDIILDGAKGRTPSKLTPSNTPNKQLTNEDIKNKLVRAEERRQVNWFYYLRKKPLKQNC